MVKSVASKKVVFMGENHQVPEIVSLETEIARDLAS